VTVPTTVVIPTRDNRGTLCASLVTDLLIQYEFDKLLVFDNSDEQDAADHFMLDKRLKVVPAKGKRIYEMWDWGWEMSCALFDKAVNVAFLNDDIKIPDNFLGALGHAVRSSDTIGCAYPDYTVRAEESDPRGLYVPTTGTYRAGGMCGWAFMIRGELRTRIGPIDTQFEWWFGDDDLERRIREAGFDVVRIPGLGLDHESEATARLHDWTHEAKDRDADRYRAKYK
jgi:hypothetical protein